MATETPDFKVISQDPTQTLQRFDLLDLEQYKKEKSFAPDASRDFHLFFVGRDDVHNILKHILSRTSKSLYCNCFGFDDEELNDIIMQKIKDPSIAVFITLDKSQSCGAHEKRLLDADREADLADFNTHFVIGTSATSQISHSKGGVCDGKVSFEGSTNWSNSGEGTFVVAGQAGGVGYKAQNNTLAVMVDPNTCVDFTAELILEHMAAQKIKAK